MPSSPYRKLWSDPALQDRINEGIRLHRQSDATIRITDHEGKPLEGVKIAVAQHDSAFSFGANIFKLSGYPSEELNREYEETFCGIFNAATVPLYWRALEPEPGRPRYGTHSVPISRRPPPDTVVEFCRRKGLRMHGHPLVWTHRRWFIPDWLPRDPGSDTAYYERRFQEIGQRYGSTIRRWDVLNESVATRTWPWAGHPVGEDYEQQAFSWAERFLPADARFDINETTAAWDLADHRYAELIACLRRSGARVGGVGLQFHLFTEADVSAVLAGTGFPPADLFAALDRYGAFGLPIHVSEITLPAPGNTPEGLQTQAELARNFYRLWFSHPATDGITWWNLPDGGAAQGEGQVYSGLLFDDLSPKPAYGALRDLIRSEWRTRADGITGGDGCFRFRGFHGTYHVRTDDGTPDAGLETAITLEPGKAAETLMRL